SRQQWLDGRRAVHLLVAVHRGLTAPRWTSVVLLGYFGQNRSDTNSKRKPVLMAWPVSLFRLVEVATDVVPWPPRHFLRQALDEKASQLDPIRPWQADVHDDQIGIQSQTGLLSLDSIFQLREQLEAV